jgi:hypothetical protein
LVRIVVAGAAGGIGGMTGWYVDGPAEGMAGVGVSGGVSESIVILVEKHSRSKDHCSYGYSK